MPLAARGPRQGAAGLAARERPGTLPRAAAADWHGGRARGRVSELQQGGRPGAWAGDISRAACGPDPCTPNPPADAQNKQDKAMSISDTPAWKALSAHVAEIEQT
jgi:hypothetical protein